ncbi:metal-dependent transcriptional regulator [Demequina aurantiaca]|uniref:metal-dependent transcriptional regulator n=1 Tax=Demequina aurantiaca TaxID=676200 RepID=UPI000781DAE4|nr:metal-dependent transcriptional regulator [Demequina aurantiaca]
MSVTNLTSATQDYLKAIWSLGEWSNEGVTVTAIAERLGIRTSTASDGVKKLVENGFAEHSPYGAVQLTELGSAHAVSMVRRHRLMETYLVREFGYDWDEVHEEAEVLEHAVSDRLLDAIDARLGHPTRDPHGDPIPSAAGAPHLPDAFPLSSVVIGDTAVVARISDADPERLRDFAAQGLVLDATVDVVMHSDATCAMQVEVNGRILNLSAEDADAVWVVQT